MESEPLRLDTLKYNQVLQGLRQLEALQEEHQLVVEEKPQRTFLVEGSSFVVRNDIDSLGRAVNKDKKKKKKESKETDPSKSSEEKKVKKAQKDNDDKKKKKKKKTNEDGKQRDKGNERLVASEEQKKEK